MPILRAATRGPPAGHACRPAPGTLLLVALGLLHLAVEHFDALFALGSGDLLLGGRRLEAAQPLFGGCQFRPVGKLFLLRMGGGLFGGHLLLTDRFELATGRGLFVDRRLQFVDHAGVRLAELLELAADGRGVLATLGQRGYQAMVLGPRARPLPARGEGFPLLIGHGLLVAAPPDLPAS